MRTDPKKAKTMAKHVLQLQKELGALNERAGRYDDRARFFKKQSNKYAKKFEEITIDITKLENELTEAEFL